MPNGFFFSRTELATVREPPLMVPRCGACKLDKGCKSPKMPYTGSGRRGVLVVGEAPGADEDEQNRQFVGKTGQRLRKAIKKAGADPDRDCWFTNAVICRPKGNELPDKAIDYCRPNLLNLIKQLRPNVIVLVGGKAVRSLIQHVFKEDVGGIKRWAGFQIPCQRPNVWICPTFHPSFIEREERVQDVLQRLFERHLAAALDKDGKPWDEVPDFTNEVRVVRNAGEAAKLIQRFTVNGKVVAFDYETDRLKPDHPDGRIVCAAVSDGKTTVAFPWYGAAVSAMKALLFSDAVGKVAHNLRFEERWTRAKLGRRVRNWRWDSMVQAHVLDNRKGICSLKFQAFALLGQGDYDGHLKPYLGTKDRGGGNTPNRVAEIDLDQLMLYCGMDSLLTHKIATIQAKQLGVRL